MTEKEIIELARDCGLYPTTMTGSEVITEVYGPFPALLRFAERIQSDAYDRAAKVVLTGKGSEDNETAKGVIQGGINMVLSVVADEIRALKLREAL